jgi:hypothetical protein
LRASSAALKRFADTSGARVAGIAICGGHSMVVMVVLLLPGVECGW